MDVQMFYFCLRGIGAPRTPLERTFFSAGLSICKDQRQNQGSGVSVHRIVSCS